MGYFPVFIDMSTKKCMIFGGGKVALRKIETLSAFDADMEVVSSSVEEEVYRLIPAEKIHLTELMEEAEIQNNKKENNLEYWLSQADYVIAATSNRRINRTITDWCHKNEIPVNVIDAPEECSFLFPSVVKRGDITIGINTGGKSPIVSKKVRKEIEKAIPEYYALIADQLGEMRDYVKAHFPDEKHRRTILKNVAAMAFEEGRPLSQEEFQAILEEFEE